MAKGKRSGDRVKVMHGMREIPKCARL